MQVYEDSKVVALRLRDPQRVIDALPPGAAKGSQTDPHALAVHHTPALCQQLADLGVNVSAPILHYYHWSGLHTPFAAQKEAAAFLTLHPRGLNLSDMGTGKTLAALWAFDYLKSQGLANKMIVFAPVSTMKPTWAHEILGNFPHLKWKVVYGSGPKRLKILEEEADIYITNHDACRVKGLKEAIVARKDIDAILIDEISQAARNYKTARWKAYSAICEGRRIVWGQTGTPTPNAPSDAWAQGKLINDRMPARFSQFQEMTMTPKLNHRANGAQFKTWTAKPIAPELVAKHLSPAIRFMRDECVDLPPCVYETLEVEMSLEAQAKLYEQHGEAPHCRDCRNEVPSPPPTLVCW